MEPRRSILGLDEDQSFSQKLTVFVFTLILGPLIGLLILAGLTVNQITPFWQSVAHIVVETLAVFWISALIFIWWRPAWFRRHYLAMEQKAVLLFRIAGLTALLWIGSEVAVGWVKAMKLF